jgi:cytidylate kinase
MNKIIAVDGPTASGKGTLAKGVARHFGLPYMNTGGLYRAVALHLIRSGISDFGNKGSVVSILDKVDFGNLDNPDLYFEDVGLVASKISSIDEVRAFLLDFQRKFAYQDGGAVLDGRDIGTIIAPDASYKFYLTATVEIRAKRRFDEMVQKGKSVDYNEILSKLEERDKKDMERINSPLAIAKDAVVVDTTNMTRDEVLNHVLSFIPIHRKT